MRKATRLIYRHPIFANNIEPADAGNDDALARGEAVLSENGIRLNPSGARDELKKGRRLGCDRHLPSSHLHPVPDFLRAAGVVEEVLESGHRFFRRGRRLIGQRLLQVAIRKPLL